MKFEIIDIMSVDIETLGADGIWCPKRSKSHVTIGGDCDL